MSVAATTTRSMPASIVSLHEGAHNRGMLVMTTATVVVSSTQRQQGFGCRYHRQRQWQRGDEISTAASVTAYRFLILLTILLLLPAQQVLSWNTRTVVVPSLSRLLTCTRSTTTYGNPSYVYPHVTCIVGETWTASATTVSATSTSLYGVRKILRGKLMSSPIASRFKRQQQHRDQCDHGGGGGGGGSGLNKNYTVESRNIAKEGPSLSLIIKSTTAAVSPVTATTTTTSTTTMTNETSVGTTMRSMRERTANRFSVAAAKVVSVTANKLGLKAAAATATPATLNGSAALSSATTKIPTLSLSTTTTAAAATTTTTTTTTTRISDVATTTTPASVLSGQTLLRLALPMSNMEAASMEQPYMMNPPSTAAAVSVLEKRTEPPLSSCGGCGTAVAAVNNRSDDFARKTGLNMTTATATLEAAKATQPTTTTAITASVNAVADVDASATTTAQQQQQQRQREQPLYEVPVIDETKMSPLEAEFRNMLHMFCNYTASDLRSLRDPRMRIVFEGVVAGAHSMDVYRAFVVLFEDFYPIRLGGRIIYDRLRHIMQASIQQQQDEIATVHAATGIDRTILEEARLGFLSVAVELNHDSYLTKDQLCETRLVDTAVDVLGYNTVEVFFQQLQQQNRDRFRFAELMTGLQLCAEDLCALDACNPTDIMNGIVDDLRTRPLFINRNKLSIEHQRYNDRYDHMVQAFREWEDLIPPKKKEEGTAAEGNGRRMEVVRGCFVGAGIPPVVEALRVVYVDIAPMRFGGDIIFSLVSAIMNGIANKRRKANTASSSSSTIQTKIK